jgi:feruloyl esterase
MKIMETLYSSPVVHLTAVAALLTACGGSDSVQSVPELAQAPVQLSPEATCGQLANILIPSADIGLPTKGAIISSATFIKASDAKNTNGEYCKVMGNILPVDFYSNNIQFEVDLPAHWNGKSVHFGGGGFDGTIPDTTTHAMSSFVLGAEVPGVPTPLARGYVTFGSDGGRQGGFEAAITLQNDETLGNYAGAHIKKTHDVAGFLMKKTYGKLAAHSYYVGGSGGGRQGLYAAQRFPDDYDGIISTFPASNLTGLFLQMARISQSVLAPGGFISPEKGKFLTGAVMDQCDALDGVKDGLISNINACRFNPAALRCPDGQDTGNACLSDTQINTIITAATPLNTNYDLANGIRSVPGYAILAGANFFGNYLSSFGATAELARSEFLSPNTSLFYYLATNATEYAIARDKNMTALRFNPVDPGPLTARTQAVSALWDATTTDLTAFQKRGGKVILQHGLADQAIPAQMSIDYYNRLVARFGQEALGQFLKFYLVPGAAHGFGNQFGGTYDALGVLDNWVVNNAAPGNLVATDVGTPTAGRTRPLCLYPKWPRYNGSGDANSAANFTCAD